jgi:hypothetical protein
MAECEVKSEQLVVYYAIVVVALVAQITEEVVIVVAVVVALVVCCWDWCAIDNATVERVFHCYLLPKPLS